MPEAQVKKLLKEEILTDEEKNQRIEELRKMVEECTSLNVRTDDVFMTRYLNCCDWNVMEAFERMKKLYKLKSEYPKWFFNTKIQDFEPILKKHYKVGLKNRDKRGRRVYLTKPENMDNVLVHDLAQLDDLWFEFFLNEPETIENGVCVLIDMKGFTWRFLKYFAPGNMKVGSQKTELLPLKNIEFHVVNSSSVMNMAVNLLYPFLKNDIKNKIYFHYSDFSSLHSHLGRECLPEEYGGLDGKINYEDLNDMLRKHSDTFDNLTTFGWDPDSDTKKKQLV